MSHADDKIGYFLHHVITGTRMAAQLRHASDLYIDQDNAESSGRCLKYADIVESLLAREITDEQIENAMAGAVWVLENDDDEEDDRVPYLSAADLGIVKCPECGGTWKIDDNCGALYRCPRCHDHGWLRVQPANLEQANGTQEVSDE